MTKQASLYSAKVKMTRKQTQRDLFPGALEMMILRTLKSLARTSFTLVMLGLAGARALALGVIGIYGVMSYTVSQRKPEIGIRMALGAQQKDVLRMVLRQGMQLALVGVGIGAGTGFGLTELMRALLFGVSPHDLLTFIGVAAMLILIALLACYVPARRAILVDPTVALRYE